LRLMVGLTAERFVGYLTDTRGAPDVDAVLREQVRRCSGHPAVLCYALANEIPTATTRWLGARRLTKHLKHLYRLVKSEDPDALVTYVNYPSTEYLELPFLDLVSFNVYLEERTQFDAYLRRLQNLAGDRPLLIAELGLDSRRNGIEAQADAVDWQIRSAFARGCAGTFVYAWTDEWFRGGEYVEDWDFGITDRARRAKPALERVERAYAEIPFPPDRSWPRASVVVCTHNGARTIEDCLAATLRLDYPDYEVIVVDDGSTDETPAIVDAHGVQRIATAHGGLGNARNVGAAAASGEIVAYLDDDAYPDPHWLQFLVDTLSDGRFAAAGGPNIAPRNEPVVAKAVACAPGGPVHILVGDDEAEHVPGCNMAFRRDVLRALGGFDPQFRIAGDDVDICWRLHQRGHAIGFSPSALVWHRRRGSVRAYFRQQRNYGKAEGLLARKWPEKYNGIGHVRWAGNVYGNGVFRGSRRRGVIYHGVWGSAPFQSVYEPAAGFISSLPAMPEWYLLLALLTALAALGAAWTPLLFVVPLIVLMLLTSIAKAARIPLQPAILPPTRSGRVRLRMLATLLTVLQPLARLIGRVRQGLTPWPRRSSSGWAFPRTRRFSHWSEEWQFPHKRIQLLAAALRLADAVVVSGGPFDAWDLEVRGGMAASARIQVACEDHAGGAQLVRTRVSPRVSRAVPVAVVVVGALAALAAVEGAVVAAGILGVAAALVALAAMLEAGAANAAAVRATERATIEFDEELATVLTERGRASLFRDELPLPT
jgi:O-antigen biosynthesis protein